MTASLFLSHLSLLRNKNLYLYCYILRNMKNHSFHYIGWTQFYDFDILLHIRFQQRIEQICYRNLDVSKLHRFSRHKKLEIYQCHRRDLAALHPPYSWWYEVLVVLSHLRQEKIMFGYIEAQIINKKGVGIFAQMK